MLEALLATCMTILARIVLAELCVTHAECVHVEREEVTTCFRYEFLLDSELKTRRRSVLAERIAVRLCAPR